MDECIERYGAPRAQQTLRIAGQSAPLVRFHKEGLTIEVTFCDGIAERLVYSSNHERSSTSTAGIDLSRDAAFLLMDKNSAPHSIWHQVLANADVPDHPGNVSATFYQRCHKGGSRMADYRYSPTFTNLTDTKPTRSVGQLDIRTSRYIKLVKHLPDGL